MQEYDFSVNDRTLIVNCKNCGMTLYEDEIICPVCGEDRRNRTNLNRELSLGGFEFKVYRRVVIFFLLGLYIGSIVDEVFIVSYKYIIAFIIAGLYGLWKYTANLKYLRNGYEEVEGEVAIIKPENRGQAILEYRVKGQKYRIIRKIYKKDVYQGDKVELMYNTTNPLQSKLKYNLIGLNIFRVCMVIALILLLIQLR